MVMAFQLVGLSEWYFYLVAVGGGLLVYALILLGYYLFNRVGDKEVARRIDQNFNLREKASTMIEFQGQESLLINKQREDAEKSIKLKSPKKLILKVTMASLPLPLLGAGAFTTSFFTQDIVNMVKADETQDNFDDETDEIIDNIKDYIGKSQASAAFKEKLYQILEELREDLKGDTSIPSRQAKVDAAKGEVDIALDEVNTKEEIGGELASEESDFTELGTVISEANVDAIEEAFADIISKIDMIVSTDGLLDYFGEWIKALETLLKNIDVPSSDANYVTFSDLLAKLQAIYDNVEDKIAGSSNATTSLINKLIRDSQEQAKKAIEDAIEKLKTDITLEKANDQLAEDVKKLMDQLVDPNNYTDPDEGMEGGQGDQDGEEGDDHGGDVHHAELFGGEQTRQHARHHERHHDAGVFRDRGVEDARSQLTPYRMGLFIVVFRHKVVRKARRTLRRCVRCRSVPAHRRGCGRLGPSPRGARPVPARYPPTAGRRDRMPGCPSRRAGRRCCRWRGLSPRVRSSAPAGRCPN